MTVREITGLEGDRREIADEAFGAFVADLDGSVLHPEDAQFAESVALWNGMITTRPAVIVRPQNTNDVVRAVNFVREQGLQVSIKAGGHNIAGLSLCDGGVTLDMSAMKGVEVDPSARIARVAAGCLIGDIDRATQEHGLATALGFVSLTGAAGLTLGGGFGYLTRRFGWSVDDLEEVEIITADGTVRRASRSENEDLFWALRGGGGNFGVVTEFVYRLHEIGPEITGGLIAWPADRADEVMRVFREIPDTAGRELTLVAVRRNAPPAPWVPEAAHGTPIIIVVATHTGTPEQAASALAPLRALGEPLADLIIAKDYAVQQTLLDATMPKGNHYYWKSEFIPALSDGMMAAYHAQFVDLKAPANQMVLFHIAGALSEHPEDDGAIGNREAGFACVIQSMWTPDSGAADANKEWVRRAWEAIRPFSTGGNYVNFQTADEPEERTAESYRTNFDRLRGIKARHDPTNLFRVNRNIQP